MKETKIDAKRIRLGKVTYFDTDYNGSAVPPVDAYAFLVDVGGTYINPFNLVDELPVYDRVPYTNTTKDGEDFGSKIVLKQGEVQDGPCYVLERINVEDYYGVSDISLSMLEDFIIESNKFFIDRAELLEDNIKNGSLLRKRYAKKKLVEDKKTMEKFISFLADCEREKGMQFSK